MTRIGRSLRLSLLGRLLNVGIRVKIMGIVLGTVLLLGLWVTQETRAALRETLTRELRGKGTSLAGDLAARLADFVLTDNWFAVHRVLRDTRENNAEVAYVLVIDRRGLPLADTLTGAASLALLAANSAPDDRSLHMARLVTSEGPVQDVAAPLAGGQAGWVRVGLSERALEAEIAAATRRLLVATLLAAAVGLGLAVLVTSVLVRPVRELVRVTEAVGEGDFRRQAAVHARDEIGQLAAAFNRMTTRLLTSQEEVERSHEQLLRQNRELSALNAVAASVSQSLELDQVLHDALEQVLRSVDATGGQILLVDRERNMLIRHARQGELRHCHHEEVEVDLGHGLAGEVFTVGTTLVWPNCDQPPPEDRTGHRGSVIGVPLQAKGNVVGTLCLGLEEEVDLTQEDLDLLTSFGHQMGVAIENARLWDDLRQKEQARTTLLQQIITAQEGERKRVARELHDQTSQSLTSLMVGLRALDEKTQTPEARAHVGNLRTQLADALEEVHRLSRELRPSALDDLGLAEALRRFATEFGERMNLVVDFHAAGVEGIRFGPETETTVYRLVQEAVTNVAKHARAQNVSVVLERRNSSLLAIVEDDGRGFETEDLGGGNGLGLLGMRERAALVAGKLSIESRPGEGTTIYLDVPLKESADGEC